MIDGTIAEVDQEDVGIQLRLRAGLMTALGSEDEVPKEPFVW